MGDQTAGCAWQEHVGFHIPNRRIHVLEGQHVRRRQCVAILGQKQRFDFVIRQSFGTDQSACAVDDAHDVCTGLRQVQRRCRADISPSLNDHFFAGHGRPMQVVKMPNRFTHTVPRDEVGHANFALHVRADRRVFHRLGHALTEVADAANFLGFVGLEMP